MRMRTWMRSRAAAGGALLAVIGALAVGTPAHAQGGGRGMAQTTDTAGAGGAPALRPLVERAATDSDLRVVVQRFNADRAALGRRYDIPLSPVLHERLRAFYTGWERRLGELDAADLNAAGRAELAELRARIGTELAAVAAAEREFADITPLVPFARTLQALQERRRDRLPIDGFEAAETLAHVLDDVRRLTAAVGGAAGGTAGRAGAAEWRGISPGVAARAAEFIGAEPDERGAGVGARSGVGSSATLLDMLDAWHTYYAGYDPLFTWWARKPYEELRDALEAYGRAIRQEWRIATD